MALLLAALMLPEATGSALCVQSTLSLTTFACPPTQALLSHLATHGMMNRVGDEYTRSARKSMKTIIIRPCRDSPARSRRRACHRRAARVDCGQWSSVHQRSRHARPSSGGAQTPAVGRLQSGREDTWGAHLITYEPPRRPTQEESGVCFGVRGLGQVECLRVDGPGPC